MHTLITAITTAVTLVFSLPTHATPSAMVFMYHHFGDDRYPSTNIQLAQFDAQLNFLETSGFHILPLPDILNRLASGQALPDKTAAITMDDAYLSVYTRSV